MQGYWWCAPHQSLDAEARHPIATRIADAYLAYMDTVFGFYEAQSRILLLTLERRGYKFVRIEDGE